MPAIQVERLLVFLENLSPQARDLIDSPIRVLNPPGFNTLFFGFTIDSSLAKGIEIGMAKLVNELVSTRLMASAFAHGILKLAVWDTSPPKEAVFVWFHSKYTRDELNKLYVTNMFCTEGEVGAAFTGFPTLSGEL